MASRPAVHAAHRLADALAGRSLRACDVALGGAGKAGAAPVVQRWQAEGKGGSVTAPATYEEEGTPARLGVDSIYSGVARPDRRMKSVATAAARSSGRRRPTKEAATFGGMRRRRHSPVHEVDGESGPAASG
jgi:hypothetical protein